MTRTWVPAKKIREREIAGFQIELWSEGFWDDERPMMMWSIRAKNGYRYVDSAAYCKREDASAAWDIYKDWPERAVAMKALNMEVTLS